MKFDDMFSRLDTTLEELFKSELDWTELINTGVRQTDRQTDRRLTATYSALCTAFCGEKKLLKNRCLLFVVHDAFVAYLQMTAASYTAVAVDAEIGCENIGYFLHLVRQTETRSFRRLILESIAHICVLRVQK